MTRKFNVSRAAQHDFRVLGGNRPSGADEIARRALDKARAAHKADAIHVTKRDRGWAILTEGRQHAAAVKATKAQAMDKARAAAAKRGARVVEHGQDGRITANTKPRKNP